MGSDLLHLEILLPFQMLVEEQRVTRLVAETRDGGFGLLPHRLDCIAALTPGILTYEVDGQGETFVAVDEGVLVKTGLTVCVSVRRALIGKDLSDLRDAVDQQFKSLNEREKKLRLVMAKLESEVVHRLANVRHV